MSTTTLESTETVLAFETPESAFLAESVSFPEPARSEPAPITHEADRVESVPGGPALAVFCYEHPESWVGQYVSWTVALLGRLGMAVHLFGRGPMAEGAPGVLNHPVGDCASDDTFGSVEEFTRRACEAFGRCFPTGVKLVPLLAHDWSAVPAALSIKAVQGSEVLVEYHSLEWQRSDASSEIGRRIAEIEQAGLREANAIIVHQQATRDCAVGVVPECAERIVDAARPFPIHQFQKGLDPGEVKARFQIGPVDPTILYVGDFSERYGPDLLVKAMPAVLRNHSQARLVLVGGGDQYWPMRVYSRYLLLDHAIRFVGDLQGDALHELIEAADLVVVPSRESTPWWPIQAAWAARRPVVATHEAAPALLEHDVDCVLTYPNEGSLVWGIERILFDQDRGAGVAGRGHQKLLQRFGENLVAEQIAGLLRIALS